MFKNLNPSFLGVSGHQSEIIELALTFGFGGMDLQVVDFATRARLHGLPYARRLIDSAKIRLGTFKLPLELEADDETFAKELGKLAEYAQAAVEVDCTRCVVTLAPAGDQRPYHENFEFHRRRLHEICKALEPSGVRLGVSFQAADYLRKQQAFQFIHDLDALTLLVNMIDAPNIGVLVDVWDVVAGGGSLESIHKLPGEANRGRPGGRNAGRCADYRIGRKVAAAARRGKRPHRRAGVSEAFWTIWATTGQSPPGRRGASLPPAAAI